MWNWWEVAHLLKTANNMNKMVSSIMAVLYVITNTLPRWVHPISGDVFCKWQSVSLVFMALGAALRNTGKVERIVWDWALLLSVNNMLDEVFGIAEQTSVWELLFATSITVWTVYRLKKQCR